MSLVVRTLFAVALVAATGMVAPVAAQAPAPSAQAPTETPTAPAAPPAAARHFTAPTGLLFNTVRPDRVADFETVIAYLQAAFEKTTDPALQAQARGWRIFKATEPGPNGSVLYVFLLDPTVPGAEYGLGPILADVYRDPAQLAAIWKLYTGAVTSGGSLLNLTPIEPVPPPPLGTSSTPAAGTETPPPGTPVAPPTSNPVRRP